MDEKKIAFITCVNDEMEYAECRYYLERLHVPAGYTTDVISIQEAPSMAAGYNAGMKSSDAKYKVYLHQDVFIKNSDIIADLLYVFAQDEQIGMVGMIGAKTLKAGCPETVMTWDTGKVTDNEYIWSYDRPRQEAVFAQVEAADGLLLATQYDLMWREEVFDGWDFYDISQCMEFRIAGLKVAVPWQDAAWCYHDNLYARFTQYYDQYQRFLQEYAKMIQGVEIESLDNHAYEKEQTCAQAIEQLREGIEELFNMEDRQDLRTLLLGSSLKKPFYLREYASLVQIDQREEQQDCRIRFWESGMSVDELIQKLRKLKHALKRIEYANDDSQKSWIAANYSRYAIADVCSRYIIDKEKVWKALVEIL